MPRSKQATKWSDFIANEFDIPEDCLWVTSMHEARTYVYIWTEKLSKKQIDRLSSFRSGGGHNTVRGKLARFLEDMNADGWFTKVCPDKAKPRDLHPITPNVGEFRIFCTTCNTELIGVDELHTQKCGKCAPKKGK